MTGAEYLPPRPWHIGGLRGKYYATKIEDANGEVIFELSIRDDDTPSVRELHLRAHPEDICDSHYETQATYLTAMAIIEAINGD